MIDKIKKTDQEWKKILTPEQYEVMRKKGTEPAFSCAWKGDKDGIYKCAACGLPLFHSSAKFESGTGWPSYFEPIDTENVEEFPDYSFGVFRTEVVCARCDSHLGHVFEEVLDKKRKRYCINSISLKFTPNEKDEK